MQSAWHHGGCMEALPHRHGIFFLALRKICALKRKNRLAAMEASGIAEETHTWVGWKQRGYEVRHQSKAFYQATITDPATKSGTRRVSNFGLSRVQLVTV